MLLPLLLVALGASAPPPALEGGGLRFGADQLELDAVTQQAEGRGHATLEGQGVILRADRLSWDRRAGRVEAQGNVMLVRGTLAVVAERLTANLLTRELTAEGALFMQKEGVSPEVLAQAQSPSALLQAGRTTLTFTATRFQLLDGDSYLVEDLEFTPCDCDATHPSWSVSAASARLTPGGRAHLVRPAIFVHGVPVFWTPLLSLPLSDRASGLLMPAVETSSLSGFSLDQPLFITLGRSYDLTLTPGFAYGAKLTDPAVYADNRDLARPYDSYGVKGARLGMELNYAPSEGTRGRTSLRLLNDLRQQRDPRDAHPSEALAEKRGLRWNLRADHAQDLGGGFHDRLDVSLLSDGYLLRDVTSDVVLAEERYIRSTGALYHRAEDRYVGLGVTFVQDIRYGYRLLGGDRDQEGNRLPGPRPLQRLPTLLYAVPERPLLGPLSGSVRLEYSRMAPLQGGGEDTGENGIFLADEGQRERDPTQGNGQVDPGERTARDRLQLRPRLSAALGLGPALRLTPYLSARESLYLSEVTGETAHRGYGLAGVQLDSEVARVFTLGGARLRHAVAPSLELRAATPVMQGGEPGRYDEVDVATPDRGFLQGRFELRQTLARKDPDGAVRELARLEVAQAIDLRTHRLGTTSGRLRSAFGPVVVGAGVELDFEAPRHAERLASLLADARWQVLPQLALGGDYERTYASSERLRRGIDTLVGEPLLPCTSRLLPTCFIEGEPLLLAERLQARTSLRLGFGLGLDYGISLLRTVPPPLEVSSTNFGAKLRLEYQTVGISYSPSCDCWRLDTRVTLRPQSPRPEFGFTVTLAKFGSFGS